MPVFTIKKFNAPIAEKSQQSPCPQADNRVFNAEPPGNADGSANGNGTNGAGRISKGLYRIKNKSQ